METDWDPNWQWSARRGWYWEEKAATKKKDPNEPKPKRTRKDERKTPDSGAASSSKSDSTAAAKACRKRSNPDSDEKKPAKSRRSKTAAEKKEDVEPETEKKMPAKSKRSRTAAEKKKDAEPKTEDNQVEEEASKKDQKKRKQANTSKEVAARPIPNPALTMKEQKKEILDFLKMAKDLTDENAKETLRAKCYQFKAPGYDCVFNVYWVQKGVKGVGCGVTSKKENKDVAFFGYKTMCDSWIYAIAAAIKSADLFVTFMRYDVVGAYVTSMYCFFENDGFSGKDLDPND